MPRWRLVAFDSDTLARHFIVRTVAFDVIANPLPVFLHPLGREAIAEDRNAEQVGEAEGPVVHELRRGDQRVNRFFAFARIVAGDEIADAFGRRERASKIETYPSEELGIARAFGGDNLEFTQLFKNEGVDEVVTRNLRVIRNGGPAHA